MKLAAACGEGARKMAVLRARPQHREEGRCVKNEQIQDTEWQSKNKVPG